MRVLATLVAIAMISMACGSTTPSVPPHAAPAASSPPGSVVTAPPSPDSSCGSGPAASAPGPYPIVSIPAASIRSVQLPSTFYQAHRLAQSGPLVVFDEVGYGDVTGKLGRSIFLVDLATGTESIIATAADGDAAWMPDISGQRVIWLELRYQGRFTFTGAITWRLMGLDLATKTVHEIDHGVNRRLEGPSAVSPTIQVDGDTVAYSVEDPGPGRPFGWKLILRSWTTGRIVRTIPTSRSIYSLALDNGNVAYSEGLVDTPLSFKYSTRLMLSTTTHPTPQEVAPDAFEVAMDGGRLTWTNDRTASQDRIGTAEHPRTYTASTKDLTPVPISAPPDLKIERGASYPAVSGDEVAWIDNQDTPSHPDPKVTHVVVWNATSATAVQVEPTGGAALVGLGAGWLGWYDDSESDIYVRGVPLASLASSCP